MTWDEKMYAVDEVRPRCFITLILFAEPTTIVHLLYYRLEIRHVTVWHDR